MFNSPVVVAVKWALLLFVQWCYCTLSLNCWDAFFWISAKMIASLFVLVF